ncbi:unnamed protein product [Polarella glacialis]|uniref:RING-type domain-containing protein n=1 Tax=Polarella glacialis TaxID=89957 RepID=A0A813L7C8_POLGL|nr:unnamed protein product [Polarella glacialis]
MEMTLSCEEDSRNGGVGAALLSLGKLSRAGSSELMIIEALSPGVATPKLRHQTVIRTKRSEPKKKEQQERWIVEADIMLEEYSSEGEEEWQGLVAQLPPPWAPGSANGRKLMEARARQCVICLTEKEHTLVPPHREHGQRVESHRFCTDCWAQFLRHSMQQEGHQRPVCPVCRGAVDVPDVWCVDFQLPASWGSGKRRDWTPEAGPPQRHGTTQPEFWAAVAPGAARHGTAQCLRGGQAGSAQNRASTGKWQRFWVSVERCSQWRSRMLSNQQQTAGSSGASDDALASSLR